MTEVRDRFVIAGWGSIGRRHFDNLRRARPDAQIAILRRPESTGDVAQDARVVTALDEALALSPRAAIIAGPAPGHIELATGFVTAGVPVLIEKPLSHELTGLAELAAAAEHGKVPVMVGYNLRFLPSLTYLRDAVADGAIGAIHYARAEVGQYLPTWRPDADYRAGVSARRALGGGVLLELSHELDYLYWMFGMPDRVSCRGGHLSSLEIDVEDVAELCLEYGAPSRLISVHLDFRRRPAGRRCELVGAEGTLTWDAITDLICRDGAPAEDAPPPVVDRNMMYEAELGAFLACVENGAPPTVSLADGIAVMRIIDAARRSLASGQVVQP